MLVEASLSGHSIDEIAKEASRIEQLGFDRVTTSELNRDPFLPLVVAAEHTSRVELATSVAIAFPRSPTVVAHLSRDLNDLSSGRFVLGLGTQVKGHIERRFATEWSSPGPRLRDYVAAVRAVWEAWDTGEPLNHDGSFYKLSLMTPAFSPGPSVHRRPLIQIAAVNTYNARLAGEACDGIRIHPFSTRKYLEETIWPAVRAGAKHSGRNLTDFEMVGGGFIATGPNEESVLEAREQARERLAFYGSTRAYLPVLAAHGWEDLGQTLRRLVARGEWGELAQAVPDAVLDEFCVADTYSQVLPKIRARYEGVVDALVLDAPLEPDEDFSALLDGVKRLRTVGDIG